mmetsp:Transcript_25755/g.41604  ORF Transcript_25755/g.41604 Transcript_25755/m.41604 type:complete len:217 (+) Transcript_25755:1779-2429(+)
MISPKSTDRGSSQHPTPSFPSTERSKSNGSKSSTAASSVLIVLLESLPSSGCCRRCNVDPAKQSRHSAIDCEKSSISPISSSFTGVGIDCCWPMSEISFSSATLNTGDESLTSSLINDRMIWNKRCCLCRFVVRFTFSGIPAAGGVCESGMDDSHGTVRERFLRPVLLGTGLGGVRTAGVLFRFPRAFVCFSMPSSDMLLGNLRFVQVFSPFFIAS